MSRDIIAIKAEGLIKEYNIYDSPKDRFKEIFFGKKRSKVFKALGPINLYLKKGDTLGIVGENGAGKSTLLKLIAGVIKPSKGKLIVNGKVSAILELGAGFHPEFTGRENIFLNASLYGLSESEILERIDDIVSFADIGNFFDMPVKFYSSGMYLRVAFSLAVHVDADIMVIDEALAVGDGSFVKKCIDKIWELKQKGVTILFCSHSLYSISTLCEKAIWIKEGIIEAEGNSKDVINIYEEYLRKKEKIKNSEASTIVTEKKLAIIREINLYLSDKSVNGTVPFRSPLHVEVKYEVFDDVAVQVGFAIDRADGLNIFADSMIREGLKPIFGKGSYTVIIEIPEVTFYEGKYRIVIFLLDDTGLCIYDQKRSQEFQIITNRKEWGICYIPHRWIIK